MNSTHCAQAFRVMLFILAILGSLLNSGLGFASSSKEIDIRVKQTLKEFASKVKGGEDFLENAKGVLVFPKVIKAGFGIGGEYGEGSLQINGQTVDYYSTAAASIGLQMGAQSKSVIIVFLTSDALTGFRNNDGWEAGVDGSIAVVDWGVGEDINTVGMKDPIVGFVLNNKGLMYNLTLEGSKYTKLSN